MSSFLRRTFSRRLPDHLLEISERIYVFDACLSNNTINENDFKSYLGRVVTSLQRFHPGASFMVFNFREGDQISLLSDILIDYDMTVVDYPRNHEGYPLLQLEMINYILRSSESWLSLGQKNVILMHCEKGGWPVLAFMLAGLLLYRKQNNGEQKTLEMVYKMAPKQLFSTLSPLNARASQLRYLQYITGRDSGLDWPPPDAHLVVDCLLLHNLPLFDGGKGCRPVVRVVGLDPSDKSSRDPQLLLSTLMPDEPAWLYPKEECQLVKLQLLCQVQGDVFLECIHLYDDLATEELIFKVMFHTGFIQSNILALNIGDIDVPWNPKYQLPKDFKAEVLFRDINEVPPQITMELGGGVEYRESDNEFFEVEEVFTPVPGSPEKKKIATEQEDGVLESKNRDYTLRNGAPRWDLESELSDSSAVLKEIAFIERNVDHASENMPDVKDIVVTELEVKERGLSEELQKRAENSVTAAKNVVVDLRNSERALEEELDVSAPTSGTESGVSASKSTVLVNDVHQSEAVETKSDIIVSENVVTDIGSRKDAPKILSEARDDDGNDIPHSGAEIAEFVASIPKNIVVDESYHNEVPESQTEKRDLEKEVDVTAPSAGEEAKKHISNNIVVTELEVQERGLSEELRKRVDNSVTAAKNVVVDLRNSERALEEELDVSAPISGTESGVSASKSTVLVNDVPQSEAIETKSDIIVLENVVVTDIGSRKDAPKILSEARDDDGNDIPDSGAEIAEFVTNIPKNIVVDESYHNEVPKSQTEKRDLEKEVDVTALTAGEEAKKHMSNNIVLIDNVYNNEASDIKSEARALEKEIVVTAEAAGAESGIYTSRNLVLVEDPHLKEASETQSEAQAVEKEVCVGMPVSGVESGITGPTNIVLDHKQVSETQSDAEALEKEVVVIAPVSGAASGITIPTNSVLANGTHLKEVSETRSEAPLPKKVMDVVAPTSEAEAGIIMSRNFVLDDDDTFRQESPETQFEARALEKEMVISAPVLGAETGIYMSRNNVLADEMYLEEATEPRSEAQALEKELVVIAPVSETESGINTSSDINLVDDKHYKEVSETKSEAETLEKEIYVTEPTIGADFGFDMSSNHAGFDMSINHIVADCIYDTTSTEVRSEAQAPEKEMDASEPVSGEESEIIPSWDDFLVDIMYDKQVPEMQSLAQVSEKETDVSAPVSGAESGIVTSGNFILVDDMFHKEDLKTQFETDAPEKEMVISALVSGAESGLLMSRNNVLDDGIHLKDVSETKSEANVLEKEMDVSALASGAESGIITSGSFILFDDMYQKESLGTHSDSRALEKEMNVSGPASGAESGVNMLIDMDLVDDMDRKEPPEKQSEKEADDGRRTKYSGDDLFAQVFGNILVDEGNHIQTQEKEADDGCNTQHLGAELFTHAFGNTLVDEGTHVQTQEKEADDGRNTQYLGPEFFTHAFGNTLVDEGTHIQTQEKEANDGRNTEYMGPEFFTYAFGDTLVDEGNHIQTQEEEIDVSIPSLREEADISTSRSVVLEDEKYHKEASEIGLNIDIGNHQEASKSQIEVKVNDGHDVHASAAESATHELKNVAVDDSNHTYELKNVAVDTNPSKNTTEGDTSIHKAASETQSDINVAKTTTVIVEASAPKNIKVVNDGSQIQQVKVEIQPKSVPSSSRPKQIKRNKWQEIASKTITQQRVVSQWVPRAKPQVPEPAKPKTTAYKWVPKGAAAPTGEK